LLSAMRHEFGGHLEKAKENAAAAPPLRDL
jgi:hypothetical protein